MRLNHVEVDRGRRLVLRRPGVGGIRSSLLNSILFYACEEIGLANCPGACLGHVLIGSQ